MERKRVLSNFQRWAEIGPFISGALSQGATTFAHHRLLIVASPLAEALHFISSPAYPCAHHRLLIVVSPLAEALSLEKRSRGGRSSHIAAGQGSQSSAWHFHEAWELCGAASWKDGEVDTFPTSDIRQ
jgi:hypothetical protein